MNVGALLQTRAVNATCSTPACLKAAESILADIDLNIDPCSDFYQYTCGNWLKRTEIAADRSSSGTLETANDLNTDVMRSVLEGTYEDAYKHWFTTDNGFHTEDLESIDQQNFQTMQDYYKLCLDEATINALGPTPIYPDIAQIENDLFPVKDNTTLFNQESTAMVSQIIALFAERSLSTLSTMFVDADDKNPDMNIVQFDQASLLLPSKEYYDNPVVIEDFRTGLNDILYKILGEFEDGNQTETFRTTESEKYKFTRWSKDKIRSAVDRVIDFDSKLANISLKNEDMQDPIALYNPVSLSTFQSQNPLIDWTHILEALIPNGGIQSVDTIIVRTPEFYKRLNQMLSQNVTLQTLQEYFIVNFVISRIHALDKTSRTAYREMNGKISSGTSTEQPRWRICVSYTSSSYGNSLGRYYTLKNFGSEDERKKAEAFLVTIHDAWLSRLPQVGWLDEQTRTKAIEKVNLINHKVGYSIISPDLRNPASIQAYNQGLDVNKTSFYDTENTSTIWASRKMWKKAGQEIDKDEWLMAPQTVNAYYTPNTNEIVIPAGILESPFYDVHVPEYLNYGGIGMIIGHELTHAFDSSGRKYDGHGNLVDWWTNETSAKFEEKTKCFIDQYAKFNVTVPDNKVANVNGKLTLGENLADNGGVQASYLAFQKLKETAPQQSLKGLEQLSPEALFFINFGRIWCRKQRDKTAQQLIYVDPHSPTNARVNGVVQNSEFFAKTFNCPAGSPMSPVKKCDMW